MITFSHKISHKNGLHAQNAAYLARFSRGCGCAVHVSYGGRAEDAGQMIGLVKLCAKCGDELRFCVEGEREEETADRLKTLLAEIL